MSEGSLHASAHHGALSPQVRLPDELFKGDGQGVRGGVDFAFTSTTRDRAVALSYARTGGIVFEIQMGMVDRGAEVKWLSQYPFEEEIIFPPLSAIEVQAIHVHGSVLAVEVRLSVNMMILTVSEILSKLQRSHLQLLDLIVSDLRHARAPERALAPLLQLRSRAKLLGPSWFVNPTNYRAETNTALDAWEELFERLENDKSVWGAGSDTHEDDEVIADRMRRVATLAALTGHETAAVKLLQLAVERMPLQTVLNVDGSARRWGDSTAGPEAVTRAFEAALHASAHHGAIATSPQEGRLSLEAALLLLLEGVEPPWPSVLVRLACYDRTPSLSASEPSLGERAFATLLEPLVQRHRFAPGASVLVWNSQGGGTLSSRAPQPVATASMCSSVASSSSKASLRGMCSRPQRRPAARCSARPPRLASSRSSI
jgi:hypothetical protein